MTETLLFFVAVLAASIVVMWCERNRLERQIASLLSDLASERSTVSRQMIELAEVKADAVRTGEQFATMQAEMRAVCLQVTKERDQIKMDYDYVRNALWEECETSSTLRHSRAVIIEHCRKLKRSIGHDRFAHKIEIDCANGKVEEMKKERDNARKLMDETRERCGAEIDVLEDTIRDLQRQKSIAENRGEQLHGENNRLRKDKVRLLSDSKMLRQSRQKIIDHCRKINRDQKKFIRMTDYILDELTTINTSR